MAINNSILSLPEKIVVPVFFNSFFRNFKDRNCVLSFQNRSKFLNNNLHSQETMHFANFFDRKLSFLVIYVSFVFPFHFLNNI